MKPAARTWWLAACGALLGWLALPPLAWAFVGWFAMMPWLLLAVEPRPLARSDYWRMYVCSTVQWLVLLEGIRLAHPAQYVGWWVLSAYLGLYHPLFVAALRIIDRWPARIPLAIQAIVVGVGLEGLRNYFATGFGAGMLGHTQADWPISIQVADLAGTYAVSAMLLAASAGLVSLWRLWRRRDWPIAERLSKSTRQEWSSALVALSVVGFGLGYGAWRLAEAPDGAPSRTPLRVALLQANAPARFEVDVDRDLRTLSTYARLTIDAVRSRPGGIDLIIWPESVFTAGLPYYVIEGTPQAPPDVPLDTAQFRAALQERQRAFEQRLEDLVAALGEPMTRPQLMVGCAVIRCRPGELQQINGSLQIVDGRVVDWYAKQHLVMFGEYLPGTRWLPWLARITPLGAGVTAGNEPRSFQVNDWRLAPSICFETVVERVVQRSFATLAKRDQAPDILVNQTNDAWFQGHGVVGLHRASAILLAAGLRRTVLSAGNGGPTMWVDGWGRVQAEAAFEDETTLFADVSQERDPSWSVYQSLGDVAAQAAACFTVIVLAVGGIQRFMQGRSAVPMPIQP